MEKEKILNIMKEKKKLNWDFERVYRYLYDVEEDGMLINEVRYSH